MFSNGFWDFLQVLLPRKEGRKEGSKEARKQGSKAARQQGSKEARKQEASKRGREEGAMYQCRDAHYTLFFVGEALRPPRFFKFQQVTQNKTSKPVCKRLACKAFDPQKKKGPGHKQLLVIGFSARGCSIYVVFLAGEALHPPPHPLLLMVLL